MEHISQLALASLALYGAIVGAFLGAVYDVFRILRIASVPLGSLPHPGRRSEEEAAGGQAGASEPGFGKRKLWGISADALRKWLIFTEDILFSLICSAVCSVMIFHINSGHPRWFILLGCAAGFALYYNTAGRLVIFFSSYIILFIRMILRGICLVTVFPVMRAVRFLAGKIIASCIIFSDRRGSRALRKRLMSESERGFGLPEALRRP